MRIIRPIHRRITGGYIRKPRDGADVEMEAACLRKANELLAGGREMVFRRTADPPIATTAPPKDTMAMKEQHLKEHVCV